MHIATLNVDAFDTESNKKLELKPRTFFVGGHSIKLLNKMMTRYNVMCHVWQDKFRVTKSLRHLLVIRDSDGFTSTEGLRSSG